MKKVIICIASATLLAAGVTSLFQLDSDAPVVETINESVIETTKTEYMTTSLTALTSETLTTTSTTITTSVTESVTTYIRKTTKAQTTAAVPATPSKDGLTCLGTFKGTYYSGKSAPCKGGSGRTLIDCSAHGQGVKGSIAARYIYQMYGYKRNGRTKVYIECKDIPSMNGWYYVDDCCGSTSVVDFYYYKNSNCPFRNKGVISVKVYA